MDEIRYHRGRGIHSRYGILSRNGRRKKLTDLDLQISAQYHTPSPYQLLPRGKNACAEMRKPQYMSLDEWFALDFRLKHLHSHVGRIEETDAGVVAPKACKRCAKGELRCIVYTDAARQRDHPVKIGSSCSCCRRLGKTCTPWVRQPHVFGRCRKFHPNIFPDQSGRA